MKEKERGVPSDLARKTLSGKKDAHEDMSSFSELPTVKPDAAFTLLAAYKTDTSSNKVDLCPGFYRDENGRPWILSSVIQAKERIHADPKVNHEHLPLAGHTELLRQSKELVFGKEDRDLKRVASIQTVSGTGANHLAALFLSTKLNPKTVWFPNLGWINHTAIWKLAGSHVQQRFYPYFNGENQIIDFDAMVEVLREAQKGDVIVLHACAHNPTGVDLSKEQWNTLATICKNTGLFPVFDLAYQGLASGDVRQDASAISDFFDRGNLEFVVAQSYSKNFGLYGERIGILHIAALDVTAAAKITPALTQLSRAEITSCPSYGARIISQILGDLKLYDQWLEDLATMHNRMKTMRESLYHGLLVRKVRGSWDHILTDTGMFSMTGLSTTQVTAMKEKHHIYLLPSGRISVTGLTTRNIDHVVTALEDILGTY
ncbi:unnamed protein product [Clonostachys chloroleuca]|uniref:Aspartate aminotransferase n=1 Tax=Clonostachys chloroleuca TaxID=1926264 RepID=A0AA35LSU1_9HYPO|nr:unnamed protein product [Clonostachys chloroleuca]